MISASKAMETESCAMPPHMRHAPEEMPVSGSIWMEFYGFEGLVFETGFLEEISGEIFRKKWFLKVFSKQ